MGCRHDLAINGRTSTFFGSGSDVLGCDLRRNFFENGDGLSFPYSRLVFLAKQYVPSTPNIIIFSLWSLKGILKLWQQAFTF